MTTHLPVLIVVGPLFTAVLVPLLALRSVRLARLLTLSVLLALGVGTWTVLAHVLRHGTWHYALGGWEAPWGIAYVIDPLAGGMAVLIAGMAIPAVVSARLYMLGWAALRVGAFYSLFLLLVASLIGMVVTGDMFNLYVFLEIASLAAYALLATGGDRAVVATFRYVIIGTIAATLYLLGVGYLYALTGTLNMADLTAQLPTIAASRVFVVGVAFLALGLAIKAALFPLHGWLPDVYTYAPAPVSGFIAAVMAKVSAYALLRILFFVLQTEAAAGRMVMLLKWAALVAILLASLLALAQHDIRRMLAYSSVGQMGYILLGLTLGTPTAMLGALLHMVNHAAMKGCLFLAVGAMRWPTGGYHIADFAGMGRRLPWSMAAFGIAAFSMIGIPPTAGFFSKWYLLSGAMQAGEWGLIGVLVVSSLLSVVYFFRVFEVAYFWPEPVASRVPAAIPHRLELPASLLGPILGLALTIVLLGFGNQAMVNRVLRFALP